MVFEGVAINHGLMHILSHYVSSALFLERKLDACRQNEPNYLFASKNCVCSGMEQLDLEDIIGSTPSAPIIPKASPARRSSILCVNCGKRDEVESMRRLRFSHV